MNILQYPCCHPCSPEQGLGQEQWHGGAELEGSQVMGDGGEERARPEISLPTSAWGLRTQSSLPRHFPPTPVIAFATHGPGEGW